MRSLRTRVILAASVMALAGAAWVGWRWWSASTIPLPELTLLVNGQSRIAVPPGVPLTFAVSLAAPENTEGSHQIGSRARPWHRQIRLELADTGQPVPWPVLPLGRPRAFGMNRETGGLKPVELNADVARLDDPLNVYTVAFGLDPAQAVRLTPGRHTIRAVLELPFWPPWAWRGRVTSDAVVIEISQATAARHDGETLRFYLAGSRFEEARKLALELLTREPRSVDGYMFLGDALSGLGHDREALQAYQFALQLVSQQPAATEPPAYLLARKAGIERRLASR